MKITEETIRERLAADKVKPCRLATWEEIEFLLEKLSAERNWADAVLNDYIRNWPHYGAEHICPPRPPDENYPRAMERYSEWMSTR